MDGQPEIFWGAFIRELAKDRQISPSELAAMLETSPVNLGNLFRLRECPSGDNRGPLILKLSKALRTTQDMILFQWRMTPPAQVKRKARRWAGLHQRISLLGKERPIGKRLAV